jgi:hypothetical protein
MTTVTALPAPENPPTAYQQPNEFDDVTALRFRQHYRGESVGELLR